MRKMLTATTILFIMIELSACGTPRDTGADGRYSAAAANNPMESAIAQASIGTAIYNPGK